MKTTTRSISASELKSLTGAKRLAAALTEVARRMERRAWKLGDKSLSWSGINWEKDTVLFFWCANAGENSAAYMYFTTSIADAIDCIGGNLNPQEVTRRA